MIITSFNEWPEGTYIEPSQAYGDRYLGLTAEWAGRFKSGEAIVYTPPAPSAPSSSERAAGREPVPTAPPTPVPTPSYAAVRIQTPVLNLRSQPGTAGPLLGQATTGSVWRATGRLASGSWWQVCCVDGQRAWVSGELVQPIGPTEMLDRVPVIEPTAGRRSLAVD